MTIYKSPIRDIQYLIEEVFDMLTEYRCMSDYSETSYQEIWRHIINEQARFIEAEVHPLNQIGHTEGCYRDDQGNVFTPSGYKEAYQRFCKAGWTSLSADKTYGGQGFPYILSMIQSELLSGANVSWNIYVSLTRSAARLLYQFSSNELKQTYLPHLISGNWTATMCLTEAQAGTDLGLIQTKAIYQQDGSYLITGTKIFISSGEHDLAENIIHLVLARVEGAEQGIKGLSLFVVPKYLPASYIRNTVICGSIENKMGMRGNPTTVLYFQEAKGFLVGQVNTGMQQMFLMMNTSRLGTALQGIGLGEVAFQNALQYAKTRQQSSGTQSILIHGDVQRMLMTAKAYNEAARAFVLWLGFHLDCSKSHSDIMIRQTASDIVTLLTPVAKAFVTDNSFYVTTLCQQVMGGHGYIVESGVEQFVRDARITQIYEGTNGIQAQDLLQRKIIKDGGKKFNILMQTIESQLDELKDANLDNYLLQLKTVKKELEEITLFLIHESQEERNINAIATDYLRLIGHLIYAFLWLKMMKQAALQSEQDSFYRAKIETGQFYWMRLFPETQALIVSIRAGLQYNCLFDVLQH